MLGRSLFLSLLLAPMIGFAANTHLKKVYPFPLTPDEQMTPGEICTFDNPDFIEKRYGEQIPYCKRAVSGGKKRYIYSRYKIPSKCRGSYTIDHFYPLSIGGNNEVENLWPEHKKVKDTRKNLEWEVYLALKAGDITQQEALDIIFEAKYNPSQPANPQGECG